MNPKDLLPSDGGKSSLVIAAIVVLLSGFFLFTSIQAKNREHRLRVQKEQELSVKLNELAQAQTEIADLKKQKEESEARFSLQMTQLQTDLGESRKSEAVIRQKMTVLQKDKDQLGTLIEQNGATIAKLNKKIEKMEQEKEDLRNDIKRLQGSGARAEELPLPGVAAEPGTGDAPDEDSAQTSANISQQQSTEVVDLGQIVLHGESREPARVEHVNTMYGFIVVSAGSDDGLQPDTVLNVARNNRFIAKAVVKKVRSSVATAVLLPEWTREEIRLGDQISVNPLELPKESAKRRVADFLPR